MRVDFRRSRPWLAFSLILILALVPAFLPRIARSEGSAPGETLALSEDSEACMACHNGDLEDAPKVDLAAYAKSPHAQQECQSCHTDYTPEAPHTPAMRASRADCAACHDAEIFEASVHARADKVPGDHPTCVTCHAGSGDAHAIEFVESEDPALVWTRAEQTRNCAECHSNAERMDRYGVARDAATSYEGSFHGKALLRFGMEDAAGCADCHEGHNVQAPSDPKAPTHAENVADTCGKCHPGAPINFAMSGANHLRLTVDRTPILLAEHLFFRWLTGGVLVALLSGIALDLRRKVFSRAAPRSGRLPGALIALSFLLFVAAIALAAFAHAASRWVIVAALAVMALAVVIHAATRKPRQQRGERVFARLTVAQRVQHALLAVSFTLLVLTGMPLRFAHVDGLEAIYDLFGGFAGARIAHRAAAVVMIGAWIWHTLYLIYRWKKAGWSLSSWTMLPTRKDVRDVVHSLRYYFGLTPEEPRFDRFQFREKFDYFAVYWGMPIMVFSGLVLWFPVFFGNHLPEIGIVAAFIAHSDEAVLAFLAIVTWHMYNVHFNPDAFPMSPTWYTGTKTREEMEREHPLELERLDAGE